jgi:hypothetical protein
MNPVMVRLAGGRAPGATTNTALKLFDVPGCTFFSTQRAARLEGEGPTPGRFPCPARLSTRLWHCGYAQPLTQPARSSQNQERAARRISRVRVRSWRREVFRVFRGMLTRGGSADRAGGGRFALLIEQIYRKPHFRIRCLASSGLVDRCKREGKRQTSEEAREGSRAAGAKTGRNVSLNSSRGATLRCTKHR